MSATQPRVATGVEGLDRILNGGYPSDRIMLLEGEPGTGKTTLALHLLTAAAVDVRAWAPMPSCLTLIGEATDGDFEGEPPTLLPNHLNGTTPQIEGIRPKSPTQLREEAERKQRMEFERAQEKQRQQIAAEQMAAAEMGIELAPQAVMPIAPPPRIQHHFKEQSPFMAPDANKR